MLTKCAQPIEPALPKQGGQRSAVLCVAVALFLILFVTLPAMARSAEAAREWPWPLVGDVVTAYKNGSDRYARGQHRGVDIAASPGATVRAIVDGRVSYAGTLPDGGVTVTILSRDGRWLISNLHLSARAVARGTRVRRGQLLGRVGTSGRRSAAAPHLHLSVRDAVSRDYVDPMTLLGEPRLATLKSYRAPSVHALERAANKSRNNVRAHTTGDEMSASRHGVRVRRPAASHSAGKHAREGHAAEQIGRVAPPPIALKRRERGERPVSTQRTAQTAKTQLTAIPSTEQNTEGFAKPTGEPKGQDGAPSETIPRRMLLLAIAVVSLVALLLRRRSPAPTPTGRAPQEAERLAEVVPLVRQQRRA